MEKNLYISGLLKNPNKNPKNVYMENNLANMRKLVNGDIEVFNYKDILLVCNRKGKINRLEPNIEFDNDLICGSILIFGNDEINGDFISLSVKQMKKYKKEFSKENSLISSKEVVEMKRKSFENDMQIEL